jgi:predicted kinase
MALFVVIGPPASGKSTWVREHAKQGDIVIDFDLLAMAMAGPNADPHDHPPSLMAVARAARTAAIEAALRQRHHTDVYVIHSSPSAERMAEYHRAGAKVVTVDPGKDVVRQRCKGERPARMFGVIDAWYKEHGTGQGKDRGGVKAPAYAFPPSTSRDW